jgi:transcriptional regulator with XRE-family HTH domain
MTVKELRASLGISQQALAAKLGVSLGSIRVWEYGKFKPMPVYQERIDKLIMEEKFFKVPGADDGVYLVKEVPSEKEGNKQDPSDDQQHGEQEQKFVVI